MILSVEDCMCFGCSLYGIEYPRSSKFLVNSSDTSESHRSLPPQVEAYSEYPRRQHAAIFEAVYRPRLLRMLRAEAPQSRPNGRHL
jgi:hypothetical protein